jgi:biopolymer transport protein ExbD
MKRRSRELGAPDITPLIDVVFLLLIFFMVSTVFKKDEVALLLNLPKMAHGESKAEQKSKMTIELSIDELAVDGKKVSIEQSKPIFASVKDKTLPIEVRIDKEVKYDRVVSLLDALKEYELTNLSLITDK